MNIKRWLNKYFLKKNIDKEYMLNLLKKLLVEFSGTLLFLYVILSTMNPLAIAAALYIIYLVGGNISGGKL